MTDHVAFAESDSGLTLDVACPACRLVHRVSVSRLGWFAYTCGGGDHSGLVEREGWARARAAQAAAAEKEKGEAGGG